MAPNPRKPSTSYRMAPKTESSLKLRPVKDTAERLEPLVHVIRKGVRCDTEPRGFATPQNRSLTEIVVDASEGFVPLWERNTTLRWRFRRSSLQVFEDPDAAAAAIEAMFGEAIVRWEDAAPIKFAKRQDAWDFEIVMRGADNCNPAGCVLASAFFPDAGRHQLRLYPKMFEQDREEQIETLIHEIGHTFGLRHFFAQVSEAAFPSEIFGKHSKFSIMNYGADSKLTARDKSDLRALYQMAWSGEMNEVNGTPIKLVKPFHTVGEARENVVAVGQIQTAVQPSWAARRALG